MKSVVIHDCNLMKVKELLNDLMAEKEVNEEKEEDTALIPSYEGKRRNFISLCDNSNKLGIFSEISRETESTFKGWVKAASKQPAPKQIGIGAACGWMSGYIMMKVGKRAMLGPSKTPYPVTKQTLFHLANAQSNSVIQVYYL